MVAGTEAGLLRLTVPLGGVQVEDFQPVSTWQKAVGLTVFILVVMAVANRIAPVKKLVG